MIQWQTPVHIRHEVQRGECNGCGACCDPVSMPYTREEIMAGSSDPLERVWAAEALVPMGRREAKALVPHLFEETTMGQLGSDPSSKTGIMTMFYRCLWFDRDTRRCAHYEDRPRVCSEYPWYGGDPLNDENLQSAALPPTCGYLVEIGRQPVPVSIIPKPVAP